MSSGLKQQEERMISDDEEIVSIKIFGFFLSSILFIVAAYSFYQESFRINYSAIIGLCILGATLVKVEILTPLYLLWMKFLSISVFIINPLILVFIFFILITPLAFFFRIFGRDKLGLRFKKQKTYWVRRNSNLECDKFKNQY
jgi:hypothetical protein